MLIYLFEWLEGLLGDDPARLMQYISFRAGVAVILSLIISMLFGGRIIRFLQKQQLLTFSVDLVTLQEYTRLWLIYGNLMVN